jgi:hypothetical protein
MKQRGSASLRRPEVERSAELEGCGDSRTRKNILKQAAGIRDLELGGLLPSGKENTSSTDFVPLSQLQLMQFKGDTWERFGGIVSGDVAADGERRMVRQSGYRFPSRQTQSVRAEILLQQRGEIMIRFNLSGS